MRVTEPQKSQAVSSVSGSTLKARECYHYGLPVPQRAHYEVTVGGDTREMCCAGCEAVASAIIAAGLGDYYTRRDNFPESPLDGVPGIVGDQLGLIDRRFRLDL
jgi:Cu2+-exporting ATPase